jgi:hypothetical protein
VRISTFVRALRPVDLLLPVGAALVSAGLQKLTEREVRQRAQLASLQGLVERHREALGAAGVALDETGLLLVDEHHPLDVETMPTLFPWHAPGPEQDDVPRPRRRGWKLAAIALAGVAGVTLWANRGRLVDEVLLRAGFDDWPEDLPSDPQSSTAPTGDLPADAENLESELGSPNQHSSAGPAEWCGWAGCDYRSPHVATLALHRNACTHRPANAHVPE